MTTTEKAVSEMTEHYNCAQPIFFAFCDGPHIHRDIALKMVAGLGSGDGAERRGMRRCHRPGNSDRRKVWQKGKRITGRPRSRPIGTPGP